ncbi:MAG TPA: Ig-like domain-containing protein [Kofleriaceae bacterium]
MRRALTVWLVLWTVAGCGGDEEPKDVGAIEVSPSAVLLTEVGDGMTLAAQAFDPEGRPMAGALTWRSSNPDVVSIDGKGTVTALAAVGSAQITAELGDAVSAPMLVVVAEPVPGAILVTDSEVVDGPDAEDPAALIDLGLRVRLTVAPGIEVSPGAIMLARESKLVAGRVVSAEPADAGTAVVLETVAVPDLFRQLSVDDTYHLDTSAVADASADALAAADEEGTFRIGPLVCKKPSPSFSALTGEGSIRLEPDLTLVRHLSQGSDGQVASASAIVSGSLVATGTLSLKFRPAIEGKISCTYKIKKIPLPIGGPISVVAGFQVPIGIKGEITLGVQSSAVDAKLEIKSTSHTTMGFTYAPETGVVPIALMTEDVDIKPTFNLTELGLAPYAAVSVAVGPTAGLDVGISLPLLGEATLSLIEAWLQLKAEAKLTHPLVQLGEPAMASNYEAKVALAVGPGSDAKKALSFLSGAVTLKPALSIEKKLARSPIGTLMPDRTTAEPGETVRLSVNLDATTTKFFGVPNVGEIRIYHGPPGLELEVIATLPAGSVSWDWHPTFTDLGIHTFWATVETVFGPGIPLEIKEDSSIQIHVGPRNRHWEGQITFDATGEESSTSGQFATQVALSTSGSSTLKQNLTTPEFLDEVSATGSLEHTEIVTFTPLPGDPDDCIYRTVTTSTTTNNSILPRTQAAAQFVVDDVSGVYTLYFQPATFTATLRRDIVATLFSGPGTCEPTTTSTSMTDVTFAPEDLFAQGTFTPGSDSITGTVTLETGLDPVATYTMNWTLTRQ